MIWIKVGAIFSILVVLIGAFGSHGLSHIIKDKMDTFKIGVQYHMFHSIALLIVGILSHILSKNFNVSGYLFSLGIILFSGSLYLLSIYKHSIIGIITPIGGVLFIFGWIALLYQVFR